MDPQYLFMAIAVFGASALQSATGIGFGVIAGPVLLMVLNSGAAIQLSIGLSLLIAAVMAPSIWRDTDRLLLLRLLAGSAAGVPIGLAVFLSIEIGLLKLLAGLAVLFTLVFLLRSRPGEGPPGAESTNADSTNPDSTNAMSVDGETARAESVDGETARAARPGMLEQISLGVVSGVMSGSLAMPGPVPAAWMSARSYSKHTIRATILTLFIFSYLAALALQAIMVGIGKETLRHGFLLAAPTLAGVIAGRFLTDRLTERAFRRVLISVLTATAGGLFVGSIPELMFQ